MSKESGMTESGLFSFVQPEEAPKDLFNSESTSGQSRKGEGSNNIQLGSDNQERTRRRKSFAVDQLLVLEFYYEQCKYLRGQLRSQLAKQLKLTEAQVKIWFQNRRAKDNRCESARIKLTSVPHGRVLAFESGKSCKKCQKNHPDDSIETKNRQK